MIELKGESLKNAAELFASCSDSMVWSCLEGCMGHIWADRAEHPRSAQAVLADFCFFAGQPDESLVRHRPPSANPDFLIMVPADEEWAKMIESIYGSRAARVTRYAIKKEKDVFNAEKLRAAVENAEEHFQICLFDEAMYHAAQQNEWSRDFCSQFPDYAAYRLHGLGVGVLYHRELVSGASSYTWYHGGIEIEIDTRHDFRRRGLAFACGARLILECQKRGLYPSWDAQNKNSVTLAEKLGYHFEKEYPAYEITGISTK